MVEGIKLKVFKYVGYKQVDQQTDEGDGGSVAGEEDENMFSTNYWFGDKDGGSAANDPILPGLSKSQRIIGFFLCLLIGLFCFGVAGLCTPFLILKIRKFVLLYTLGSLFTIGSFALLWGPVNHIKHIFSYGRLPFTFAYFGAMFATLYSALVIKSTTITLIFATLQIVSLAWYIFSYIPGGTTGLKFFSKLFASFCTKTVSKALPI